LWPNQLVKARLLLTTRKGALVIPAAVVQRGPQGTFAYVVNAEQKAEARPIQIDAGEGDTVVVTSGLDVGEQVVVDGQYQLRPGAKVEPRDASAPPGGKEHRPGKEGKKKESGAAK
jgi:multidrug efflux system membrane fusion protein